MLIMAINRFDKIHNVGLFKDFTWPVGLENFSKFNLIYGGNGTGKTTLSRILDKLGKAEEFEAGAEISISADEKVITESDFTISQYGIKVFNRDFVSNYILTEDSTKKITIGQKSVEVERKLITFEDEKKEKIAELVKHENKNKKIVASKNEFMSKLALEISDKLTYAGVLSYKRYNRTNLNTSVEEINLEIGKYGEPTRSNLSTDELLNEIDKLSSDKEKYSEFEHNLPDLNTIEARLKTLLQTEVVNQAITKLQQNPSLANWIKEGLAEYYESDDNFCPWCEQAVPNNRIIALINHFNDSFDQLSLELDEFSNEIEVLIKSIPSINDYRNIRLYNEFIDEYDNAVSHLEETFKTIIDWLNNAKNDVNKKRSNMNISINLSSILPILDFEIIDKINTNISQHNEAYTTRGESIELKAKEYEKIIILNHWEKITEHKERVQTSDEQIKDTNTEIDNLNSSINDLESEALDATTPLEDLNKNISEFLGHEELQFTNSKSGTGYILCRGGNKTTGDTLSEGEQTIISLLYFLKSLNDSNFDSTNAIIVFDDPVSSLDSNYFHSALAAILETASSAKQSFIFTHNFAMFSEVKRKYSYGEKGKIKFKDNFSAYMLEIEMCDENRKSTITPLPKILSDYNSEYYYLFDCLLSVRDKDSSIHKWHYNFPNMARRFLETFLEFKYPGKATFSVALDAAEFDNQKKEGINRYLNKFSHRDDPATYTRQVNPLPEARQVAKYILDMVKKLDNNHYDQMEKIVIKSKDSTERQLAEILHSFDSKVPILAAYFLPLQIKPPPGNWAQPELLVIAKAKGDKPQRFQQFTELETKLMDKGIHCVLKIYTPEEMITSSIPLNYPNLMKQNVSE